MLIRFGFVLSLILNFYFILISNSPERSKLTRISKNKKTSSLIKNPSEISREPMKTGAISKATSEKEPIPGLLSSEEIKLQEQIKYHLENAKKNQNNPSQVALDWGKKLPHPKTKAEYALKFILMQYHDHLNAPIPPGSYKQSFYVDLPYYFKHLDGSFTDYMKECLRQMGLKEELNIRAELYNIANISRDEFPFLNEVQEDYKYQIQYEDETTGNHDDRLQYYSEKAQRYLATDQKKSYGEFETTAGQLTGKFYNFVAEQSKEDSQ